MEQYLRYLKYSQRPTSSQMQKYLCTCYSLYIIFLSYEHLVEIERISFVPCHEFRLSKYISYYLIVVFRDYNSVFSIRCIGFYGVSLICSPFNYENATIMRCMFNYIWTKSSCKYSNPSWEAFVSMIRKNTERIKW